MCDVNIATGELERSRTDVYLTGYLPIEFTRFYYSNSSDAGFLGRGWRHSFNERLRRVDGLVAFEDGFGDSVKFEKVPGTGQLVHGPGGYALAETGGNWVVQDEQGLRRFFAPLSDTFVESRPSLMLDVYGNALGFHYDRGSPTFAVTDQLGRVV